MSSKRSGRVCGHDTEHPASSGQRADQLASRVVDAHGDELAEHSVAVEYPQRAVSRVDEVDCCLHDLPQRHLQVQSGGDGQQGLHQPVHPVPGAGDLLDPLLDLAQQLP
jgi:hypothetical protein